MFVVFAIPTEVNVFCCIVFCVVMINFPFDGVETLFAEKKLEVILPGFGSKKKLSDSLHIFATKLCFIRVLTLKL